MRPALGRAQLCPWKERGGWLAGALVNEGLGRRAAAGQGRSPAARMRALLLGLCALLPPSLCRASGAAGTRPSTAGWFATSTSRWAAPAAAPPSSGPASSSSPCGTTWRRAPCPGWLAVQLTQACHSGLAAALAAAHATAPPQPAKPLPRPPPRLSQWRLMGWAWLVCLAFLPEMGLKAWARSPALAGWRHTAGERRRTSLLLRASGGWLQKH